MGNCLVKKLLGTVNNSDLIGLNELRWKIKAGEVVNFSFKQLVAGKHMIFTIIDGTGEFTTSGNVSIGTTLDISSNETFYNKVVATTDIVVSCNIDGLNLEKSDFMRFSGLLEKCYYRALYQAGLKTLQIAGWNGNLTINQIKDAIPTPANLETLIISSEGITGSITDLIPFSRLKTLRFMSTGPTTRTLMSGSLDDYAQGVASSRSAGTCDVYGNNIITYKVGGVDTVIGAASKKTITFDGAGGYTIS